MRLRSLTSIMWDFVACLSFAVGLHGCVPYGLGGTLGGEELAFEDAVYFELRGVDSGTATPFHDLGLWLTPLADPCERLPQLVDELASLRAQQQAGLPPVDYCNAWEALMFEYLGEEPFWHAQIRLKALPRAEDVGVETLYPFHDEVSTELADSPNFDGDVLLYPAPTFDACAEEFSGSTNYAPTQFSVLGGEAEIAKYSEDAEITTVLHVNLESLDTDAFEGRSSAKYCIPARDFPLQFGLGF